MSPKKFLGIICASSIGIYLFFYIFYLANPLYFHYRAWELFDNFVYNGYLEKNLLLNESGDSSREYLFQSYNSANYISINEFGNRLACFNLKAKEKQVLMLGDSQLFGSGLSDNDTFPKVLCQQGNYNIYNGSRVHGLNLLRTDGYNFKSIIFTVGEQVGIRSYCNDLPIFFKKTTLPTFDAFIENYDRKINPKELEIKKNRMKLLAMTNRFLQKYLASRLITILDTSKPLIPLKDQITKYHFKFSKKNLNDDLECASKLDKFFNERNIKVSFLYFPAKQTLVNSDVKNDNFTSNYISNVTSQMRKKGLSSIDSKACLLSNKDTNYLVQPHDTHLSAYGMKVLAGCLLNSNLKKNLN